MKPKHKKVKVFISPRPSAESENAYIAQLSGSLSKTAVVLNGATKEVSRSMDLLRHGFGADVLILNWSEDIVNLRYGIFQSILFNAGVLLARLRGSTILWVCHNRKSHHRKHPQLTRWNRTFFKAIAHTILVHSGDAKTHLSDVAPKVVHLPHPRYSRTQNNVSATLSTHPVAPVLIWGSISAYKGLDQFIERYKELGQKFETLIIGKAKPEYHKYLETLAAGTNIRIVNSFIDDKQLSALFEQTKIVLLPYLHTDTFSSGALIHSINSNKIVIGPEIGNFKDLQKENACLTYTDYNELFDTLNALLQNKEYYQKTLEMLQQGMNAYYDENSWDHFASRLQQIAALNNIVANTPAAATKLKHNITVRTELPNIQN